MYDFSHLLYLRYPSILLGVINHVGSSPSKSNAKLMYVIDLYAWHLPSSQTGKFISLSQKVTWSDGICDSIYISYGTKYPANGMWQQSLAPGFCWDLSMSIYFTSISEMLMNYDIKCWPSKWRSPWWTTPTRVSFFQEMEASSHDLYKWSISTSLKYVMWKESVISLCFAGKDPVSDSVFNMLASSPFTVVTIHLDKETI